MQTTLDGFFGSAPKWNCVFCFKSFVSKLTLATHIQSHEFVTCDLCSAIFIQAQDLLKHKELHVCLDSTREPSAKRTKWICDQCSNVSFASKDNLRRHMLSQHSLRCTHCDIACSSVDSRKDHESLHFDPNYGFSAACEQCEIRCASQTHIEFHVQKHHRLAPNTSEEALASFLQSRGIVFTRNWSNRIRLPSDCTATSARPDFYLHTLSKAKNISIFVDNDENQHKRYPNEWDRLLGIEAALLQIEETKDIPIVFVRFNPGTYVVDGATRQAKIEEAHERLLETINNLQTSRLTKGLNLIFMFYDTTQGQLNICKNNARLQDKILQVIT